MSCYDEYNGQCGGAKSSKPRVTFSEYSSLCVFHEDPRYSNNKSYKASDKIHFKKEMLYEVKRIKLLVMLSPGSSTQSQLMYLIENKKVTPEELIGNENLLLVKNPIKLENARKDYIKSVLREQERQYTKKIETPIDYTKKLGAFSASMSVASMKRARTWAAIAAMAA